jgi:hypothetical protein
MGNVFQVDGYGRGTVVLNHKLTLTGLLVMPDLKLNLFLVNKVLYYSHCQGEKSYKGSALPTDVGKVSTLVLKQRSK